MAYGEMEVTGRDVLEALTFVNENEGYRRELMDEGQELADLFADHIIARLKIIATTEETS